jgi:hypothetical protein
VWSWAYRPLRTVPTRFGGTRVKGDLSRSSARTHTAENLDGHVPLKKRPQPVALRSRRSLQGNSQSNQQQALPPATA